MTKDTMERFYKSQEIFRKYKNMTCNKSVCYYQLYSENVLVEKWALWKKETGHELVLVEFYPDGDGFTTYFEPHIDG
jgi:hypothetical protein